MPDLLVKLYDLPVDRPSPPDGYTIRPVAAHEVSAVAAWVSDTFSAGWADEFRCGAYASPVGVHVAETEGKVVGFSCHDVAAPGLFGPTGVDAGHRGKGLGLALLFAALDALVAKGYAYAVIGWAGPVSFYERAVGAVVIPGSDARYGGDTSPSDL